MSVIGAYLCFRVLDYHFTASQPPALKIMNNFLSPSKAKELSEHDTSFSRKKKKKKREAGGWHDCVSLCADGCARLTAQSAYLIGSGRLVVALLSLSAGKDEEPCLA